MVLSRCPFCTHSNPAGARFCNECGSPLHLRPCEHCEAVNDVLSRECHRCGAPLRIERQREPALDTPAFAHGGDADAAPRWDTTVAVAYGEAPRAPKRAIATWRHAGYDIEAESRPTPDAAGALDGEADDANAATGREPFVDDDLDRPGTRRARDPRRPLLTFIVGATIVGLAVLGGYTFLQRGTVSVGAPPSSPAAPTPENPATSAMPEAREPARSEATPPSDALSPAPLQPVGPASQNAPLPDAGASNESAGNADTAPEAARGAANASASAQPPKADRKPAPSAKASQDAIETKRIITRELGGFGPPPTR